MTGRRARSVPVALRVALGVVVTSTAALLLWLGVSAQAEVAPTEPVPPSPGAGWPVLRTWPSVPSVPSMPEDPVCSGHAPAPSCR